MKRVSWRECLRTLPFGEEPHQALVELRPPKHMAWIASSMARAALSSTTADTSSRWTAVSRSPM